MIPLFFSEAACCPTEIAAKGVARNLISGGRMVFGAEVL